MKNVDPLFIYYSFFRWKTKADLSYNEDIKGGSKQKETKSIAFFKSFWNYLAHFRWNWSLENSIFSYHYLCKENNTF